MKLLHLMIIAIFYNSSLQSVNITDLFDAIIKDEKDLVVTYLTTQPELLQESYCEGNNMTYAVMIAAIFSTPSMLNLLVELNEHNNKKVDVYHQYSTYQLLNTGGLDSPLICAIGAGKIDNVRYLLEHGADVHKPNIEGATPLHGAMSIGMPEMIDLLLEFGAISDIERTTKPYNYSLTPLAAGVLEGNERAIKHLLNKGADPHVNLLIGNTISSLITYVHAHISANQEDERVIPWTNILTLLTSHHS